MVRWRASRPPRRDAPQLMHDSLGDPEDASTESDDTYALRLFEHLGLNEHGAGADVVNELGTPSEHELDLEDGRLPG
eukprot:1311106-Alexandrium_andersonii.AAC.1